ncbi:MAG: type II toxin-antitoxin system RelE family toxin [Microcoleus sp.]
MSYSVEFTAEALVNQERLTQAVQERIGNKINWLAENFEQITPMPLSANLAGFFKLRVGDYRVIYSFDTVEIIDAWREQYNDRKPKKNMTRVK